LYQGTASAGPLTTTLMRALAPEDGSGSSYL
jgi:hypothetical protein